MPGMKSGQDIIAFRRLVEAELKKLRVDLETIESMDAVTHISRAAIKYAGYFHDSVMWGD